MIEAEEFSGKCAAKRTSERGFEQRCRSGGGPCRTRSGDGHLRGIWHEAAGQILQCRLGMEEGRRNALMLRQKKDDHTARREYSTSSLSHSVKSSLGPGLVLVAFKFHTVPFQVVLRQLILFASFLKKPLNIDLASCNLCPLLL